MGRRSRPVLRCERASQYKRARHSVAQTRFLEGHADILAPYDQSTGETPTDPTGKDVCAAISATWRAVLSFIDGESHHCWERLRRADCCDLCGASKPEPARAGRPAAWWATLYDDACRKLPRVSRRNRWPRADSEHAQTGREIRGSFFIRGSDRFRSEQQAYPDHGR